MIARAFVCYSIGFGCETRVLVIDLLPRGVPFFLRNKKDADRTITRVMASAVHIKTSCMNCEGMG